MYRFRAPIGLPQRLRWIQGCVFCSNIRERKYSAAHVKGAVGNLSIGKIAVVANSFMLCDNGLLVTDQEPVESSLAMAPMRSKSKW